MSLPRGIWSRSHPLFSRTGGPFPHWLRVLGQTGVETGEVICGVLDRVRPAAVIAVDALAAGRLSRLLHNVQLADTGITPGAGVGNTRAALNEETLGVPVIAVGVPTVVDGATLAHEISSQLGQPACEALDDLSAGDDHHARH